LTAVNRNELWARSLVDELARAGVQEVVVSPGSRSTPLVLAFAGDPRFRITVQIDERCAGFLALGMGRGSGRPSVVLTTSGTAAANLYPAVVEASQSDIPLLVLTADRPHRLRDADANQAIDQVRLYGPFVRAFHEIAPASLEEGALRHLRMLASRAVASAVGLPAGPVHLNLPFAKPLEPVAVAGEDPAALAAAHPLAASGRRGGVPYVRIAPRRPRASPEEVRGVASLLASSLRPLLVAGPTREAERVVPALRALARRTGIPLLADPLSGARYGADSGTPVVGSYDLFLRDERLRRMLRPDLVLRVGATPTSTVLAGFLEDSVEARQVVVDAGARWKDHLAVARDYLPVDPAELLEQVGPALVADDGRGAGGVSSRIEGWTRQWRKLEGLAARGVAAELAGPFFEAQVLAETVASVGPGGTLLVSSSMPVRDLDTFVPGRETDLRVVGNRGASGIDGLVSTALGVRMTVTGPMVAVLGDLAFYHDLNGLLAVRNAAPDLVFVVIHNDGGGIFHLLPVRQHEPAFTPYFATPHGLDFARAAALYDLPCVEVQGRPGAVRGAVVGALESGGPRIVVVRSDREGNRRRRETAVAAVLGQVMAGLDD
jgi:2-succinyl-5-enolpyruvyl-6-hydroxy-3-cyclohexene-1-carboxylate synthase